jgi:hypothetical protein
MSRLLRFLNGKVFGAALSVLLVTVVALPVSGFSLNMWDSQYLIPGATSTYEQNAYFTDPQGDRCLSEWTSSSTLLNVNEAIDNTFTAWLTQVYGSSTVITYIPVPTSTTL